MGIEEGDTAQEDFNTEEVEKGYIKGCEMVALVMYLQSYIHA